MRLLDRYIFREILTPALIALVALTFILVGRELSRLLELIVRRSATPEQLWAIAAALIPNALVVTIPTAVLIGVLTGFGRMSSDGESIAFRAVGVSTGAILRPVLCLGVLAWAVNLTLAVWIAPEAAARLGRLTQAIAMRQIALELQPRVFNENLGDLVLYVQEVSPAGNAWEGILLADMASPEEPRVTFAASGRLRRDPTGQRYEVTLENGSTHIVSALDPEQYSANGFDAMTLPVVLPPEPLADDDPSRIEASTASLWRAIRGGTAAYADQVEFHRRIALPFACVAFALLGLPLGMTTRRGGRSMGLVISAFLMLVYYMVFIGGTRIAGNAQLSPFIGTWGANLAFAGLGILLLARSSREGRNRVLDAIVGAGDWVRERVIPRTGRGSRTASWAYSLVRHPAWFRTLDVYVLKGFWFFFLLILVVFVGLFVIVTLFELLPDIVKNDAGADIVTGYFLYLMPQILYWVVPLAVLVGVLVNLGTLTKTNETLAVKAGAISLYRLATPLVAMALLLSAGIYAMQDFILPYTNQRQDEFRNRIKGRAPQTYRDPLRKWMMGDDNRIYYYTYFDTDRNIFAGLSVFTYDPETFALEEWAYAAEANWNGRGWVFDHGWIHAIEDDGRVSYRAFQRLDYPAMDEGPDYFKKEVRTASQMNYPELSLYIEDLSRAGFNVSALTVDLYRKLSFPLVSVIMAIIAIPFSFTTGRRGTFYGIGLSIVIGITYWAAFEVFDKLGGINRLSPLVAAWFPNLIFGFGGFWMLLKVRT